MAASITIANALSTERADALRRLLEGKTFLNLHVGFAPVGGSFNVIVESARAADEDELREMVMDLLTGAICDMGSSHVRRALALGVDRLNDGDPNDRVTASRVEHAVFKNYGYLRDHATFYPKEEAARGWAYPPDGGRPKEVWIDGTGKWTTGREEVRPGTAVYRDDKCSQFLVRTPINP